jgi:hypothetical protein
MIHSYKFRARRRAVLITKFSVLRISIIAGVYPMGYALSIFIVCPDLEANAKLTGAAHKMPGKIKQTVFRDRLNAVCGWLI